MRRGPWIAFLAAVFVALLAPPVSAGARGSFVIACPWTHTLPDDPIVFPGLPGGSHLHDFFGNATTKASSTYDTMLIGWTTCKDWDDTAGYWSPAGFLAGSQVTPLLQRIYYYGAATQSVKMPAGLMVIAGNKSATSPGENPHLTWSCGGNKDVTPISTHPYDCRPYQGAGGNVDGVTGRLTFPECWDGQNNWLPQVAHMAYASGGTCPNGYPERVAQLQLRVHFGLWDPCAGLTPCGPTDPDTNVKFALSSGPYYTLHADFWNTWKEGALDELVASCLNAHVACGAPGPLTPGSPSLSANPGSGTVHLSWTVPSGSGITNYNVNRGTASGGETLLTTVGNVTSYDDNAVSDGVTYYYLVAAVNPYGPGLPSAEASATPGSPAPNSPPTASFTFSCSGLACSFTDTSTDPDGTLTSWSWDFGDGASSATQHPSHTYASAGTYTVTLTVTDNAGATGTSSQAVTVSVASSAITLTAIGYKVKGLQKVDLSWDPSDPTTNVDIYRNGAVIATTINDGAYTDNINKKGTATYTYKVCLAGTSTCSNEATVVFS